MINPWAEFLTVVVAHLLAVASPGPDFAVMLRQALLQSRRNALMTAAGIASGILVHASYSLLGVGILIQQSLLLFTAVKLAGAVYLAWIAIQCLRAQPADFSLATGQAGLQGPSVAFRLGLLTNLLNPKATLFFVSLFSVVISPDTPRWLQAGYGGYMALATGCWFAGVGLFLTRPGIRRGFARFAHWLDRVMGGILLLLAGQLLFFTLDESNDL